MNNKLDFSEEIESLMNKDQLDLLNYFENFNNNNIVYLNNTDFKNGTYRITKPGIYKLCENIVFHPNPDNDFNPKPNQYDKYSIEAYHLGFFAALTIETKGVILDLCGFTIKQSNEHYLKQRFFAIIELASSPFIKGQGPGNFGNHNPVAEYVLIKNGIIGKSSHHGIHGNLMNNIIFKDLVIKDFDLAAASLNGGTTIIFCDIECKNTNLDVPVQSNYTMAKFSKKSLIKAMKKNNDYKLNKIVNKKSIDEIYDELIKSLENTEEHILYGKQIEKINKEIFLNKFCNEGHDANVYGLSFNVSGVLVNDFITLRDCENKAIGNKDIILYNIKIKNIKSHPVEVLCLSEKNGNGIQKGSIGNALDMKDIINTNDNYNGNILSDTNIGISSVMNNKYDSDKIGTNNIGKEIINWVNSKSSFKKIMMENNLNYIYGKDSMIHEMKGNIGLFLSGACNVKVVNTFIDGVKVFGNDVSGVKGYAKGACSHGILLTACKEIEFMNTNVCNIETENKEAIAENLTILNGSEWSGNIDSNNNDLEIKYIKYLILKLILNKLKN